MKKTTQEESRLLASLTVFRELYNSQEDVYGIISVFLNEIIKSKNLYSFNSGEITSLLNDTFEFNIPKAVVTTALNRLDYIKRDMGMYIVENVSAITENDIDRIQSQSMAINQDFLNSLFAYIENEKVITLSTGEKEKISHSLYSFLLDEQNGDNYIEYITAFILKNERNEGFKNQLNLIREGVILYSGIKFNNNLNDYGWKSELTIFIETEILFHLAGYNGDLYKDLVLDFLSYVTEINAKAKKRIIKLKYFTEVKLEIEHFFSKAKHIVDRSERLNPRVTAMMTIVNGCERESDVQEKKSDFYALLRSFAIEEDDYNKYFDESNFKYNIVSQDILEKVSTDLEKDATGYLKPLNYISIRRKEASTNNFDNIGYILLSGNSTTIKVAWSDLIKSEGDVPLATYLNFLTNKFWFKLNKGFGEKALPKSFSIITKAQMILSKVLNENVGHKYTQLLEEFKLGNLTEDQARGRLVDLRNQTKKPEEINNEVIEDVLNSITSDSLDKFIEEQQHSKIKAEEHRTQNLFLIGELEQKKDIEAKYLNTKKQLLQEKNNVREILERQKEPLDKIVIKRYRNFKITVVSVVIIYYFILIGISFKFTWDVMEQYTYYLSFLPFIFSFIYLLFFEKNLNPLHYLQNHKKLITNNVYNEFNFDYERLNIIIGDIEVIISDIENIENLVN